jgi:methionyl-tRNA formyltransferase
MSNKINQLPHEGKKYRKRNLEDSKILWSKYTGKQVYNLIRGMYGPYPWAFSFLGNKKIEFKVAKIFKDNISEKPGKVLKITNKGVLINCLNDSILVEKIKIGNKIIKAVDYFKINHQLT